MSILVREDLVTCPSCRRDYSVVYGTPSERLQKVYDAREHPWTAATPDDVSPDFWRVRCPYEGCGYGVVANPAEMTQREGPLPPEEPPQSWFGH